MTVWNIENTQGGVTHVHTFLKHRETPQGRPVRIGKILMLKKMKVGQPSTHLTHLNQNHLHLQLRTQRARPQAAVLEQSPLRAHAPADTAAAVPHSTGESGTVLPRPRVHLAIYSQFPRRGYCSNTRGRGSSSDARQACWLAVHSNANVQPRCAEPAEALKLLSAGREWSLCTAEPCNFGLRSQRSVTQPSADRSTVLRKTSFLLTLTVKSACRLCWCSFDQFPLPLVDPVIAGDVGLLQAGS